MVPKYSLPNAVNFKDAINIGAKHKFEEQKIDKEDIAFLQYTGEQQVELKLQFCPIEMF